MSPFAAPGTSDLTANVDFTYLVSLLDPVATPSLKILGPITQGDFLTAMGLGPRVQGLLDEEGDDSVKEQLIKGAERLVGTTAEGGMGEEYKVMGVECGAGGEVVYPFQGR